MQLFISIVIEVTDKWAGPWKTEAERRAGPWSPADHTEVAEQVASDLGSFQLCLSDGHNQDLGLEWRKMVHRFLSSWDTSIWISGLREQSV